MAGNIHIVRPTGDFIMVSKVALRDKSVDPFSLGIYVKILALGETDWELNLRGLSTHFGLTEDRIRRAFRVLEDAGYMSRKRVRDEKNHFIGWDYDLYTAPNLDNFRPSENPDVGDSLNTGKRASNNNTITQTQDLNINEKKGNNNISRFDFRSALLGLGVPVDVADTWLEVRRRGKAVNSELAFKDLCTEIAKTGQTAEECIRLAAVNSWRGFKAEYIRPKETPNPRPFPQQGRKPSVYEKNAAAWEEFERRLKIQHADEQ